MTRRDAEAMGVLADLAARARLGKHRGLEAPGRAKLFEEVTREAVSMLESRPDDNVVLLGAADLRPIPLLAGRCRQLVVVDDLPEEDLSGLGEQHAARGESRVRFQWGRANVIPTPQYTTDRILSLNYVYRSRHPYVVLRQMHYTSRHGSIVVCCEPSSSLDARTARKYSREAELSMEDHRALIAYARSAAIHRQFTREGLKSLMESVGIVDVEVRELLHGLVLAARGAVKF
jgi:hypothetical protein